MNEMSEKARQAKNQYQREYYRKNPERKKQYNARYWERKALKMEETNKLPNETKISHPETPKSTEFTNICLTCGEDFKMSRSDQKFCSNKCRLRYHRQQKKEEIR